VSEAILAGHRTSVDWTATYAAYALDLVRYLTRLVRDPDVASDLMQDAFVRAMAKEDSLRDERAVRAWLYQIATNLARNHRSRQRLLRFVQLDGAVQIPQHDIADSLVPTALGSIAFDQASALVLHHYAGFTRAEIAQMTGLSPEGVKSRLSRGRANFIAAHTRLERGLKR
jgi:RNA polymerase sigma-70 factor (ECF subfamily)